MASQRLADITQAAEGLFSARGYHATSMRELAGALDMQAGSLYAHIASKSDVLASIVDRAADAFQAGIAPIVASDAPADARLRRAIRAHVGVITGNLPAATVYFHDWRHLAPGRRARVRARRDRYEAAWRRIIADGVAEGTFGDVDPRMGAILCLSACNWTYQWYDPEGPLDPDALAETLGRWLLGGLLARPVDPAAAPQEASPS